MKKFLYNNKTIYTILFSLILVNFIVIGCQKKLTHEERVNTISNAMFTLDNAWNTIDPILVKLRKEGHLSDNALTTRNVTADLIIKLNKNWKLVPQTDASIANFVLDPDFAHGLALVIQLSTVADQNDIQITLLDLQKLLGKLINEGN